MSTQRVSSNTPYWKYDVYISFNSEDTENNFTDHLYTNLERKGIAVFRGENELESQAIEESRFLIVIFSRNYAHSTRCLDELVKIVHGMKVRRQTVIPIFYHVDPSTVRKQEGNFQEAFARYEETFKENIEKLQMWRKDLTEVANLSGWHLKERRETQVIAEIVKYISNELHPLGSRLANLEKLLVAGKSCFEKLLKQVVGDGTWFQWGPTLTVRNYRSVFFYFFNLLAKKKHDAQFNVIVRSAYFSAEGSPLKPV